MKNIIDNIINPIIKLDLMDKSELINIKATYEFYKHQISYRVPIISPHVLKQ